MSKTFLYRIGVLILLLSILFTGTAFAQEENPDNPQSIPNGPWLEDEQTVKYEALMSNEELYGKLFQIEARSKGRMKVEQAGDTGEWPIYVAKFGEADPNKIRVLIESQIHGGEPLGTEAVVFLMQQLATSSNPEILNVLDKLTIWIVPRLNPDGFATFVNGEQRPRRQNHQTWTPGEWGLPDNTRAPWYYSSRSNPPGYDINRDFSPNLDFVLGPAYASLLPGRLVDPGFFETHRFAVTCEPG
ncbi:MAG: M14 family zinc carboxypeptidase, partial [Anaerolineales bacterium]